MYLHLSIQIYARLVGYTRSFYHPPNELSSLDVTRLHIAILVPHAASRSRHTLPQHKTVRAPNKSRTLRLSTDDAYLVAQAIPGISLLELPLSIHNNLITHAPPVLTTEGSSSNLTATTVILILQPYQLCPNNTERMNIISKRGGGNTLVQDSCCYARLASVSTSTLVCSYDDFYQQVYTEEPRYK